MRKHPELLFVFLAFLFSWSWWGWMAWHGLRVVPGGSASHLPGLLGPAFAAIVVTWLLQGRTGLADLGRRCVTIGHPLRALGFLLVPSGVAALTIAALALSGNALPDKAAFLAYPGVPATLSAVPALALIIILNGFGEELGWRGWLLEHLVQRHGRLGAAFRVGLIWAVWHIPLFWVNQSMADMVGPMLAGWLISLLLGSFVMAHVYFATGRSVLAAALWHVVFNLSVATPATAGLVAVVTSTVVMIWGGLVIVAWWRQARSARA